MAFVRRSLLYGISFEKTSFYPACDGVPLNLLGSSGCYYLLYKRAALCVAQHNFPERELELLNEITDWAIGCMSKKLWFIL